MSQKQHIGSDHSNDMVDTRGIMINQDAYDALKSVQKEGESLSQTILQLVSQFLGYNQLELENIEHHDRYKDMRPNNLNEEE